MSLYLLCAEKRTILNVLAKSNPPAERRTSDLVQTISRYHLKIIKRLIVNLEVPTAIASIAMG
ncbi:hypothetical protein GCM10007148_26250 [Parvularcula lutaonensis]|nr:hypothetical protein GCM10007148_26250 [Parvularcula lutaonensis]